MEFEIYEYDVCHDCFYAAMTGDPVDPMDEHGDREKEVWDAIEGIIGETKGHFAAAEERDEGFSWRSCECCKDGLGGSRYGLNWLARV